MYYVGIDISKYKHDCFITCETGEVILENLSFSNTHEGFTELLTTLNSLDKSKVFRIGFESTGHYGINLKCFLEKNNFSFMEFNPLLVNKFISSSTLRKTKTDKVDAIYLANYLMSVEYKPHPTQFYHKLSLKSLCRSRENLVKQRSQYKVAITNNLDLTFPEFKGFFKNNFSATALFILNKYGSASKIKNMKDFESIKNCSRGRFKINHFIQLKELAKNTIGTSNEIYIYELEMYLKLYFNLDNEIKRLDEKIELIIKELNPPTLSIPGIGLASCAGIISEYGDIKRFKSADAMVAFAGLEPSIIQSGTLEFKGKMVKRGSGHLRYLLMNVAAFSIMHNETFAMYYYKKREEGKCHRVALSHLAKKIIRIIYSLETKNILFDHNHIR